MATFVHYPPLNQPEAVQSTLQVRAGGSLDAAAALAELSVPKLDAVSSSSSMTAARSLSTAAEVRHSEKHTPQHAELHLAQLLTASMHSIASPV